MRNALRVQKAALIGSVSDWLVASDVPAEIFLKLFGITLEVIPWNTLRQDYSEQKPDPSLLNRFNRDNPAGLVEAAKVLTFLRRLVAKMN